MAKVASKRTKSSGGSGTSEGPKRRPTRTKSARGNTDLLAKYAKRHRSRQANSDDVRDALLEFMTMLRLARAAPSTISFDPYNVNDDLALAVTHEETRSLRVLDRVIGALCARRTVRMHAMLLPRAAALLDDIVANRRPTRVNRDPATPTRNVCDSMTPAELMAELAKEWEVPLVEGGIDLLVEASVRAQKTIGHDKPAARSSSKKPWADGDTRMFRLAKALSQALKCTDRPSFSMLLKVRDALNGTPSKQKGKWRAPARARLGVFACDNVADDLEHAIRLMLATVVRPEKIDRLVLEMRAVVREEALGGLRLATTHV